MPGFKKTLTLSSPDSSLPFWYDDPLLTEGSLLLVDPAHPAKPWDAGVPANGAALPNLAWKPAARMIGSGSETTLGAKLEIGTGFTSSVGVLERSTKGGLHGIMSPTTANGTNKGAGIRPQQALADWIAAHPTHSYYFSIAFRMTRFGTNPADVAGFSLSASPSKSSQNLLSVGSQGPFPAGATRVGYRLTRNYWDVDDDAALAAPFSDNIFSNIAVSGYTGTPTLTGASALAQMKVFGVGSFNPFIGAAGGGHQSALLYYAYLEDLTVSGRTYAQVDALDYARYQKQVLTSGGRYYGDTYTTPALA